MSHSLFCWEMGLNAGHVRPQSWLAREFERRGHTVSFSLKDQSLADAVLGPEAQTLQAPLPASEHFMGEPMHTYTDILRHQGYTDSAVLSGLLDQWLQQFDALRPDFIVGDHAPTALLAARIAGIPSAAYGIGFLVPPLQAPMPLCEWWKPSPPRVQLRRAEREVLTTVNQCLEDQQCAPLERVADILDVPVRALATVPDLDDYIDRPGQDTYLGLQAHPGGGHWPGWSAGSERPRLLGYLRAEYATCRTILAALDRLPVQALIYIPDCPADLTNELSNPHIQIHTDPLDVKRGAAECDAALSYASIGFVADILAAGKPLLVAPPFVQHAMIAQRVLTAGAGVPGEPFWGVDEYESVLGELIERPELKTRAEALAARINAYPRGPDVDRAIVDACERYL